MNLIVLESEVPWVVLIHVVQNLGRRQILETWTFAH